MASVQTVKLKEKVSEEEGFSKRLELFMRRTRSAGRHSAKDKIHRKKDKLPLKDNSFGKWSDIHEEKRRHIRRGNNSRH